MDASQYGPDDVIDATMHSSLEWCVPSPPPTHLFEEQPIIKETDQ